MDILDDIIDYVIAAIGDDTRLLKQCSLVSSSFLLPIPKRLFSRIFIKSGQTCQRIQQLRFLQRVVHLTILELNSLSPNEFCDENSSSLTWAASTGTPIVSQAAIDLCVALRGGRCAVRDSLHLFVYYEDFIDEPRPDEDEVAKSVLYFTRKAFWSASKLLWERGSGKNCRTLSTPRSMAVEQMASGREKETGAHLSPEFSLGWFRKVLT